MTSPEEWERINVALDEILALPRTAWPAACTRLAANNVTLRHELDSLLARIDGEDPILDFPAGEAGTVPEAAQGGLAPGELIGAYRVIELLGYGGMGEVYRAERADGQFEHQVAIKLMRLDVGSRPSRFKSERQILARLVHPNIATLHDGGITGDGRAYMVMESVAGLPITRWCREHASCQASTLLGDAYEGAGRASDARPLFRLALDDAAGHLRPGHPAVLEVRERWARFLLDHPDAPQDEATARAALTQVIADGGPPARYTPAVALAHADLAMLALRGADLAAATAQMRAAKASLAQVQAVYDVRIGDELQLLESEVLAAKRQTDEARQAAAAGLVAAEGHDARESPGLQHARGVLAALPVPVR